MQTQEQSVQDDLAFMRALVEARDNAQRPFGEVYLAAGLIYGVQMVLHAAQGLGVLPASKAVALVVGLGPTVVFLAILTWILRDEARRQGRGQPVAMVSRATQAVFGAVGLANVALAATIGAAALRHHSLVIWLIYPCVVFALQGAAWLVTFAMRRQAWLGVVGIGWFVAAFAMGLTIDSLAYYVLIAGIAFLLLMVVPGAVMIALARKNA
jgi:hypothetical protein